MEKTIINKQGGNMLFKSMNVLKSTTNFGAL
jgi:hypothetical protein